MDYSAILSRAWQITWRWKMLWILGFLVALGSGGINSTYNYTFDGSEPIFSRYPALPAILTGLICFAVILGIVIWVLSVMARGGLIAGVAQVQDTGGLTFSEAWRAGQRRFWTLFGISILAAIPIFLAVIIGIVMLVVTVGGLAGIASMTSENGGAAAALAGGIGALLCAVPFICGLVIAGIVLNQIRIYAERAAILEGLGWVDAFRRGWRVLRDNLGPTLIFWIIFVVLGLVIGAIVLAVIGVISAPFIATGAIAGTDMSALFAISLAVGAIIGIVIAALIGSVIETFTSATWTLLYRQLTATTAAPLVPPVAPPPAPVIEA